MKAYFLFTGTGPIIILTSYNSVEHPKLVKKLESKGIAKFIAYEVPIESTKSKYGTHFDVVCNDLHESDDLRVLDYSGERAFKNFSFNELKNPIYHEPKQDFITTGGENQIMPAYYTSIEATIKVEE